MKISMLAYPKFHPTIDEIRGLIEEEFLPFVETVTVKGVSIQLERDSDDAKFIECALAGMCHGLSLGTLISLISAKSNRSRLSLLRSFWGN
jgi:hypothetical protein